MRVLIESLEKIHSGGVLSEQDMAACLAAMMREDSDMEQAGALLTALSMRGETRAEITGAARALRGLASTITSPPGTIDCCGTGGDGLHTWNISTAVALVAAACGATVAKHGNRSSTSKSGAADVLEKLGVPLTLPRETLESALSTIGFCFLMAPAHHQSMKHVAALRRALGRRTIFNLLGPLANPAGAAKQLVGVYDKKWLRPMAGALHNLGTERAMVVHGDDGLDEITLTGPTHAAILENGAVREQIFTPDDFGLAPVASSALTGGDAQTNADALLALLHGETSAYRDIVLANTAAVLWLHDGRDLLTGVIDAAAALDTGAALSILERYKALA